MRDGLVTASGAPESGPLSVRWGGLRRVDRVVVLAQVSGLLSAGASLLEPAEVLTVVCEAAAGHLRLRNVVFFKRIAGQSRALAWSAPGASTASRMIAREQAWSTAAQLVEGRLSGDGGADGSGIASVSVWDADLSLSAMLYVESRRALDDDDRALLDDLLRRMLGMPDADDA